MSRNRNEEEGHENSERWLLTYSDMITLLLALFIMLFTMSNVDSDKYKALAEQLSAAFSGGSSIVGENPASSSKIGEAIQFSETSAPDVSPTPSPTPTGSGDISQEDIEGKLKALIKSSGLGTLASVRTEERGVVVSFKDKLLFPTGSAEVNDDAKKVLKRVADIIELVDNYIRVEGSTDNVPIHSGQFPSNWELASQRAINVLKVLVDYGVKTSKISPTSYGEYRPVVPNNSEDNKQLNRRVDIVFVNRQLNVVEPGSSNN